MDNTWTEIPPESAPPPSILSDPTIARYADHWGRPGDLGRLAELSLAVLPPYRSQGIGTRLLAETLADAAPHFPAISLSVTSANPALRLYTRHGFRPLSDQDGTTLMLWQR